MLKLLGWAQLRAHARSRTYGAWQFHGKKHVDKLALPPECKILCQSACVTQQFSPEGALQRANSCAARISVMCTDSEEVSTYRLPAAQLHSTLYAYQHCKRAQEGARCSFRTLREARGRRSGSHSASSNDGHTMAFPAARRRRGDQRASAVVRSRCDKDSAQLQLDWQAAQRSQLPFRAGSV